MYRDFTHTCDDTHTYKGHAHIEEGTAARLEFVRNYSSLGVDESTRSDASDRDTGRGCGRTVDVGSDAGGAGRTRLKGLRTYKSPGMPASVASAVFAASVARRGESVVVLPSGNTRTEESRHMRRIPRIAARMQACVGDTGEVEQEWTHTSNRDQRSTPSIQVLFVAGIEPEKHPGQRQFDSECPLRPFREYYSATDASG